MTNQTCPVQSYRLKLLSKIYAADATEADMENLRIILSELQATSSEIMSFRKLDIVTTELRFYTDASFANNRDLSAQLVWCIYAADDTGRCNILHWSSRKFRLVMNSTFAAELFALIQSYDAGPALWHSISALLGGDI